MILKVRLFPEKTDKKETKEESKLERIEFVDHIRGVRISSGCLCGTWDNQEGEWVDNHPLESYEFIYLLNDNGKTIDRLK